MNVKKNARRVMSGLLTAVTVLSTVLSPAVAYASDDAGSVKKIPYYEEIKDQLDEDEVVTAKDYEIKVGDNFDVKSDYTGLTIQDDSKVKVTFQEAKDTDGNDFSTDYANSYKAVYYVEPQTTDHPTYQINRKIVVKEADQQKDSQSESSSDQDAGSSDKTETEDSEADSSTEETDAADTESKTELTEKNLMQRSKQRRIRRPLIRKQGSHSQRLCRKLLTRKLLLQILKQAKVLLLICQ